MNTRTKLPRMQDTLKARADEHEKRARDFRTALERSATPKDAAAAVREHFGKAK